MVRDQSHKFDSKTCGPAEAEGAVLGERALGRLLIIVQYYMKLQDCIICSPTQSWLILAQVISPQVASQFVSSLSITHPLIPACRTWTLVVSQYAQRGAPQPGHGLVWMLIPEVPHPHYSSGQLGLGRACGTYSHIAKHRQFSFLREAKIWMLAFGFNLPKSI